MLRKVLTTVVKHGRRVVEDAIRVPGFAQKGKVKNQKCGGYKLEGSINKVYVGQVNSKQVVSNSWVNRLTGQYVKNLASSFNHSTSIFSRNLLKRFPIYAFVGIGISAGNNQIDIQHNEKDYLLGKKFCEKIKSVVAGKTNETKNQVHTDLYSGGVKNYVFGNMISKGCNAAVYEAKNVDESVENAKDLCCGEYNADINGGDREVSMLNLDDNATRQSEDDSKYDQAVKVMFNLFYESNQPTIFRGMDKELIPAMDICENSIAFLSNFGNYGRKRKKYLPQHPNIIKFNKVFVDDMMEFDQCQAEYPDSLPVRLNSNGLGRNKTLYIVMKRYPTTLREYVKSNHISTKESLLIFAQLLEGILHLNKNRIAHRDLKSDNILLDTTKCDPQLVIADFGCCVEGLKIPFNTDEVDKGGNFALMAPEIANAEAGANVYLNYTKSDLWAAGTLAYEIFGMSNPFYGPFEFNGVRWNSQTYREDDLPAFEDSVPVVFTNLVKKLLKIKPKQRPSCLLTANAMQLILWAPKEWLDGLHKPTRNDIINWLMVLFIDHALSKNDTVAYTLKRQFLSRLDLETVIQSFKFLWNINNL